MSPILPALLLAGLLFAGCAQDPTPRYPNAIMTPSPRPLPAVPLRTASGPIKASEITGRWTWVYFGFGHCPDVCPAAMEALAAELKRLKHPERVRPLFISVDPARDTPERLGRFVRFFDPRIEWATGEHADLGALTRALGAAYVLESPDKPGGNYNVSHSNLIFVLDPQGRHVATYAPGAKSGRLASDFDALAL